MEVGVAGVILPKAPGFDTLGGDNAADGIDIPAGTGNEVGRDGMDAGMDGT